MRDICTTTMNSSKIEKIIKEKSKKVTFLDIRNKYLNKYLFAEILIFFHTFLNGHYYEYLRETIQTRQPFTYETHISLHIMSIVLAYLSTIVYYYAGLRFWICYEDAMENLKYKETQKLASGAFLIYLGISGFILAIKMIECFLRYTQIQIALLYVDEWDFVILMIRLGFGYLFNYER